MTDPLASSTDPARRPGAALRRSDTLDRLVREQVIEAGVARAATVGVAVCRQGRWVVEVGAAGRIGEQAASTDTVFDLASVSKPFVATAFARLVERGVVRPAQRLVELLPELHGTRAQHATLEALLSHRAGLTPHLKLYAPHEAKQAFDRLGALRAAADACISTSDPEPAVYSDMGYLLAGEALARAAELPLDGLVEREVCAPLGLFAGSVRTLTGRDSAFQQRVAPTEFVAFRGGLLRGVVHDENAWAYAGHGLAGHAGLFGTLEAVLGFGCALLDALSTRRQSWLSGSAVRSLVAERPSGTLRLGFDGKSEDGSSAGDSASRHSFGHLGFTGTSCWCDPLADSVTVLLTNRVCPTRQNNAIRRCRPQVHEALNQHGARLAAGQGEPAPGSGAGA